MRKLVRIIGLLLGALLVIGIIPDAGDSRIAHNTQLPSALIEGLSSRFAPALPASTPQSSQGLLDQAESGSQATRATKISEPLPGDGYLGSVATLQPPDRIEHQPRPRATQTVAAALPVRTFPFGEYNLFIHTPPDAPRREPLVVVLALHGMGGHGDAFASGLLAEADRSGWLVVAPTLPYGDYMNPATLAEDDILLSQMLVATLDALPSRLGLKLQPSVMVYGFSRGAQLAHRFALFFPERVKAVVAISAGTYTLPADKGMTPSGPQPLPLPYGVADVEKRLNRPVNLERFKKIPFFIEVGEQDTRASDVPRQFDVLVGTTRVERAKAFHQALQSLGMMCQLVIVPNTGHEVTSEMSNGAMKFLKENTPTQQIPH